MDYEINVYPGIREAMMQVSKWGNSLAVRLPAAVVDALGLKEGDQVEIHDWGLAVCERYSLSLYDSMLVAAALISGAKVIYSEDLQDGQVIDSQLRVINPF